MDNEKNAARRSNHPPETGQIYLFEHVCTSALLGSLPLRMLALAVGIANGCRAGMCAAAG